MRDSAAVLKLLRGSGEAITLAHEELGVVGQPQLVAHVDTHGSELARLVPEYVTLPRGARAATGTVAWSRDPR